MPTADKHLSEDELSVLDAMLAAHQQDWWDDFSPDSGLFGEPFL
jgi:hypothetical protein